MSTPACGMCSTPMLVKTISTTVPGTRPVRISKCRQCDVRRCKCDAYTQDPFARRCHRCNADLFRHSP